MGVAERTEAMRIMIRAMTDKFMRMTSAFPGTHRAGPTLDELAERERRASEADWPAPASGPGPRPEDEPHPPPSRLERGHPKL